MNRKTILSAFAALVMASAALAQDPSISTTSRADYSHDQMSDYRANRLNGTAKASDIIGMTVNNNQDEKLGTVEELAVDVESGRVVEVILSTGGFLGLGNTLTAVPPGALQQDTSQKILKLDADKAKLKRSPKFDNSKWDESAQTRRVTEVYDYYGQHPYFEADRKTSASLSEDEKLIRTLSRHQDGSVNTSASKSVESARNENAVRNVANSQTNSNRNADGYWTQQHNAKKTGANSWPAGLGYVQKASKLIGMDVKNLQDQKLGDIDNLVMDLSAGRIVAVIISSGGFLGMGDELSAVPPTALRTMSDRESLQLDTTKEMLSRAPHFKPNEWPDFNHPAYVSGMYRNYQVEPYFNSDSLNDGGNRQSDHRYQTDNTARNVRDRNDQTLTPFDQGGSKADIATTAQIRKEIVETENISVNAKNVKIITRNGQVTLRGVVKTADEKHRIGEIARRIASSGKVDNQLEVQVTKSSNN